MISHEVLQVVMTVLVILIAGTVLSIVRAGRKNNRAGDNVIFGIVCGLCVCAIGVIYGNDLLSSFAGGVLGFVVIWSLTTISGYTPTQS